jgi:LemA protein
MANPLDEVTGPVNENGREARVIEKQLPVTVGVGSTLFEVLIWVVGFIPGAVITFGAKPPWEPWVYAVIWCAGILPGVIYLLMKVAAQNYFQQLQQRIQASASTIGNYQEQRYQILKNVAALVERSIKLDKEVMTAVAAYRGGTAPDAHLSSDEAALNRGFASLVPHIEAYPELKAHAQIAEAMRQNSYLQREITAARDLYNQVVLMWNTEIYKWPVKQIVAARAGYTTRIPFSVSNEAIEGSRSTFF